MGWDGCHPVKFFFFVFRNLGRIPRNVRKHAIKLSMERNHEDSEWSQYRNNMSIKKINYYVSVTAFGIMCQRHAQTCYCRINSHILDRRVGAAN